jgi:hypothetical protein
VPGSKFTADLLMDTILHAGSAQIAPVKNCLRTRRARSGGHLSSRTVVVTRRVICSQRTPFWGRRPGSVAADHAVSCDNADDADKNDSGALRPPERIEHNRKISCR